MTYQTTLSNALRRCSAKLKKGYHYDAPKVSTNKEYDLKEDAGTTTMYPVDINEVAQLISLRSYVSIPINIDLRKVMRSDQVKIYMDKDMSFWVLCFDGNNYAIGKLKYNRDKEHLPIN